MKTFEMTPSQLAHARKLIRIECAAFDPDHNECLILDDGGGCACPQYISYSMMCYHFRDAILPLDPDMEEALLGKGKTKHCLRCGKTFIPGSNAALYCKECVKLRKREEARERMFRKRHQKKETLG